MARCYHDVVIANIFVVLFVSNVCIFISLDRQDSVTDVKAMIDTSAVITATPRIICLVVYKAFEYIVNGLTHHRLTTF